MSLFGRESLVVRALSTVHGATSPVVWNCFATFLSQAMNPEVGLAAAVIAINPAVAAPVIALATVCGVVRAVQAKRAAADTQRVHSEILAYARKDARATDFLQDVLAGKQGLPITLDNQVREDIAATLDTLAEKPNSGLRRAVREEFEDVFARYGAPEQFAALVGTFHEFEETVRILLWTQDHRGREHDRKFDEFGWMLQEIWRKLVELNPAAAAVRRGPDAFLSRVALACEARFRRQEKPDVTRFFDGDWGGEYLRVCHVDGESTVQFPVAATEEAPTCGLVERLHNTLHAKYRDADPGVRSYLVCRAESVHPAIIDYARTHGVYLYTFVAWQNMVPLDSYVQCQTTRLLGAKGYDPEL